MGTTNKANLRVVDPKNLASRCLPTEQPLNVFARSAGTEYVPEVCRPTFRQGFIKRFI
jgi:hypothetical protein